MSGAERVVFALGALAEARQAVSLAQRADAVAPTGEDLMRVGLVADIPDQPVARRIEDMMQRDGQLNHAEPGAEMAAGDRNRGDQLLAELLGQLRQISGPEGRGDPEGSGYDQATAWNSRRSFATTRQTEGKNDRKDQRVKHLYRPRAQLATIA